MFHAYVTGNNGGLWCYVTGNNWTYDVWLTCDVAHIKQGIWICFVTQLTVLYVLAFVIFAPMYIGTRTATTFTGTETTFQRSLTTCVRLAIVMRSNGNKPTQQGRHQTSRR